VHVCYLSICPVVTDTITGWTKKLRSHLGDKAKANTSGKRIVIVEKLRMLANRPTPMLNLRTGMQSADHHDYYYDFLFDMSCLFISNSLRWSTKSE